MRRLLTVLPVAVILVMGLGACSNLKVNTDCLSNSWIQISPAGSYEDVIPFWNFTKDGYLYIQEGGYGKGSCIPAVYFYNVHGRILELLPPEVSSAYYPWDKPFKFKILECTEEILQLQLLSIPDGISSAGLSPATEIVKLERHHYLL